MRKAEILGERLVENPEGVREMHASLDFYVCAASYAPGGACEIAETIDGDDDSVGEWRHMEGRGEMREMMLDLVECCT